jgi:chromate reductase
MKILAISGSLRAASINSAFCRAAARLAPASLQITVFNDLGELPLFNPDLEANPPSVVLRFRAAIADADALLIASPEYAHGISGAMKNALDWLVSFEAVLAKPIALINTSPRAHHAYDSLREILQTMSTDIVTQASMTIPLLSSCITEEAMLGSESVSQAIRTCLDALQNYFLSTDVQGPSFPIA